MISILAPSRSRPEKSFATVQHWFGLRSRLNPMQLIVSLDSDDHSLPRYRQLYMGTVADVIYNENRSAVDAINNAAKVATGDLFIVISDDTKPIDNWDEKILKEVEGKTDWILKTQDGIQNYIITMPVMDRAYYNRTGYIYHPDFEHMFCDTYLTCVADITGRKITSNLLFPHLNDSIKDEVRVRSDATWQQGEKTFIQKIRNTPIEDLKKITDAGMKNWIRNKTGIRL